MHKRFVSLSMVSFVVLLVVCLDTAQAQRSSNRQIAEPVQESHVLSAQESGALLAKAASLYDFGIGDLEGFTCVVHPDWRITYSASHNGVASAPNDPDILLLNSVKIEIHAEIEGESKVEWNVPTDAAKPLDDNSMSLLDALHQRTEQMLTTVLAQWSGLADGDTLLDISDGIEIVRTGEGYSLNFGKGIGSRHAFLDNHLVLKRYTMAGTDGTSIKTLPKFASTHDGLLVSSYVAYIDRPDSAPGDLQEMHVDVEYRTVDTFHLPSRFKLASGKGPIEFDVHLDGCKTIRKQNKPGEGIRAQHEGMRPGLAGVDTPLFAALYPFD